MKRYYAAAMLAVTLIISGCIKPDRDDCGLKYNCVLLFQLNEQDASGSLMAEKLNSIDVLIFDANNHYVTKAYANQAELKQFPGVKLSLDPGEYNIVSWGNACERSQFSSFTDNKFEGCYIEMVSSENGSALYYAPDKNSTRTASGVNLTRYEDDMEIYKVVVPPNSVVEKTMTFARAHRRLNVYLERYNTEPDAPLVEINKIPYKVDFFLNTASDRKTYKQQARYQETSLGDMLLASFDTPIADFSYDMILNVMKKSDGTPVVQPLNLKQYVDENAALITDMNEIDILIKFNTDATVSITMPSWDNINVDPK